MFKEIDSIYECIVKIQEENKLLGEILMVNFHSALNTIDAIQNGVPNDLSEKIIMLSNLLGVSIEDLVKNIIEKDYINSQNGIVNTEEADKETLDFILGNSSDINNKKTVEEYSEFLDDIKNNVEFLKGEL